MPELSCPACREPAPAAARFCGRCGSALPGGLPPLPDPPDDPSPGPVALVEDPSSRTRATGATASPDDAVGEAQVEPADRAPDRARSAGRRRTTVLGLVAALLLVAAAAVLTAPGAESIVVGDGLEVPSGRGPADEPTRRWSTALGVTDPLPAVVAADTVVVAGRSRGSVRLVGLDRASGRRLWASSVAEGRPVAVTAVGRDVVVVGTARDDEGTSVVRLAARTGAAVWTAPVVVPGTATSAVTMPTGSTVLAIDVASDRTGEVLLVGDDATVEVVAAARAVATSAAWIATLDGTMVMVHTPGGAPVSAIDVGAAPVATLAVVDDLVVVAQGDAVRAFEVATGDEAWAVTADATVVGLAASPTGVAVITTAEHVGVDPSGEVVWRDPGFPLPLVRGGDDVTLLVAPGTESALELRLVDEGGDDVLRATADEGTYLALGQEVVMTGVGDDVLGTPLDGDGAPAWAVDTDGEVLWLVLDGGTMLAVSRDDGGTTVSRWV